MMKKLLLYATAAGVAMAIFSLLKKTKKVNDILPNKMDKQADLNFESESKNSDDDYEESNEFNTAKIESSQNIYERHSEAAQIMKDAFNNIMKEESSHSIDTQDTEIVKNLNSLSYELDDLLK